MSGKQQELCNTLLKRFLDDLIYIRTERRIYAFSVLHSFSFLCFIFWDFVSLLIPWICFKQDFFLHARIHLEPRTYFGLLPMADPRKTISVWKSRLGAKGEDRCEGKLESSLSFYNPKLRFRDTSGLSLPM